jgi:phage shock protein PspC (stress-responsive transcriptional regulator)
MNKVFNINLGGYPFTIDEDAYGYLDNYLKTIHNHFRQSDGYEEIVSDIESRLAELFQENKGSRQIVTLKDVKNAISVMGTPEEFGAEPIGDSDFSSSAGQQGQSSYHTGKRLYRNPDDEVIGGVCSGIASYLGIQDPLWVRIAFVVLAFTFGFAVWAYLILWAILPKAETASDRLSMRGEPVNVSNIGKIIEEEVDNVSKRVNALNDKWSKDWGSKKKVSPLGGLTAKLTQPLSSQPLPRGFIF